MSSSFSGSLTVLPPLTVKQARVINDFGRNTPNAPDSYCDFKVNDDGEIEHDFSEKTRDAELWLKFIVDHLVAIGKTVDGTIEVNDDGDQYEIIVEDSEVFVQEYVKVKSPLRKV